MSKFGKSRSSASNYPNFENEFATLQSYLNKNVLEFCLFLPKINWNAFIQKIYKQIAWFIVCIRYHWNIPCLILGMWLKWNGIPQMELIYSIWSNSCDFILHFICHFRWQKVASITYIYDLKESPKQWCSKSYIIYLFVFKAC